MEESIVENDGSTSINPSSELPPEADGGSKPKEDWEVKAKEAEAKANKWEETAGNYKKEIEARGLRDKPRILAEPVQSTTLDEDQVSLVKNDYLSKREDVIHELRSEVNSLTDEEWQEASSLIPAVLDNVYLKSVEKGHYAARGELKDALSKVISNAKRERQFKEDLEKAKVKGMDDQRKIETAELAGTTSRGSAKSGIDVTDQDRKYSESSEGMVTPERAAEIRLAKEARAKDYAPKYAI